MIKRLTALFNPERFQGWGKRRKYFEGWYYKIANKAEDKAYAIIPGIAIDTGGTKQPFIQWLDGKKKTSKYFKFHENEFHPAAGKFEISIADNQFASNQIKLTLPGITGSLSFENIVPWPKPFYSPGIMGPYAFAPFMECYHGIVSMDHGISGILNIAGEKVSFDTGRGYIEKDWGHSFPSAYVWMQSNHFDKPGTSLKVSVAKIPWMRSAFVGFIAGFWHNNRLIRFTTYNRSSLIRCQVDLKNVEIILRNKQYTLHLMARRQEATSLASPIQGIMDGHIEESMTVTMKVVITQNTNDAIFYEGYGRNTGLEVAGNIEEIMV